MNHAELMLLIPKNPKSFRKWFLKIYRIFAQTRKIFSERQIVAHSPYRTRIIKYDKNPVFDTFLFLTTLACSPKEENPLTKPFSLDKDTSLLLLLLQVNRFENYDQDVEILTHTDIPPYSGKSNFSVDLNYEEGDLELYLEFLKQEIQKYPRGYMTKGRASKLVVVHDVLQGKAFDRHLADSQIRLKILYISLHSVLKIV
ncbi:hypothetical protein LEP1GSC188_0753 [Leptospira weilii serovar Topaz str. LT2116]|uniref:Uncharacterized protein n=1 Tax=Leptospira weilii serovar Topaz str. LT2116 TaxID=1088540 RepID=M3GZQ1_9LEPT|nr:hypothetical protein LEP1GSC188_0753 [Leptospira weilii serovar Topaz str. LT2116]